MRPILTKIQLGMTLVELMVGMVVGMLVVLVIVQIALSDANTFRTRDEVSVMQDNGQYALNVLSRHLRLAGFPAGYAASRELYTATAGSPCNTAAHHLCGANNTGANGSDSLTVRFTGSSLEAAPGVPDGSVVDCTGAPRGNGVVIEETFSVVMTGATPELICTVVLTPGGAIAPVVIASNVAAMQVLFGLNTGNGGEFTAGQWVSPIGIPPTEVVAVRVGLLLQSESANAAVGTDTTVYRFFGPAAENPGAEAAHSFGPAGDGRIRRIVDTTVALRNRL